MAYFEITLHKSEIITNIYIYMQQFIIKQNPEVQKSVFNDRFIKESVTENGKKKIGKMFNSHLQTSNWLLFKKWSINHKY